MKIGNVLKRMFKSLFISYIVTFVFLLLLAFLLYKFELSVGVLNGGIIFTYVFSCFIGGILFSKRQEKKKYAYGLAMGIAYFLLTACVSMILNRQLFFWLPSLLSVFILCGLGGMLGGMISSTRAGT